MISLKITDKKSFMHKLLCSETFDSFWMIEANISTFNTFSLDGSLHYDFFDSDTVSQFEENAQNYSAWKENRPFCFSIIKGSRAPLSFKIIFRQPEKGMEKIIKTSGCMLAPSDVHGLYLNIQYRNDEIFCTTGTSFRIFTMDKSLEHTWDLLIENFFKRQDISYEKF